MNLSVPNFAGMRPRIDAIERLLGLKPLQAEG